MFVAIAALALAYLGYEKFVKVQTPTPTVAAGTPVVPPNPNPPAPPAALPANPPTSNVPVPVSPPAPANAPGAPAATGLLPPGSPPPLSTDPGHIPLVAPNPETQINVGDQVIVSTPAIAGLEEVAPGMFPDSQVQMEIDSISSTADPTGQFLMAHVTDTRVDPGTLLLLQGSFPIARRAVVRKL